MKVTTRTDKLPKRRLSKGKIREDGALLLLMVPALLCFIIWFYIPMFGLVIAFKDYTYAEGIFGSQWVGFDNFKFFFLSQDAWRITRNTVLYGATQIILNAVVGSGLALLFNEIKSRKAIKLYQTIMILPNFLSWVVVGFITYVFLNPSVGVLNQLLTALGIEGVDVYSEPGYWPFILNFVFVWKGIGMTAIMYYAAILGINQELYEAAKIDGANAWQRCRYISIPELVPLMTMLSILAVGNILRGDFGLYYQVTRDVGVLYPTTDVIDTYLYRGLRTGDIGITAAVGFFQSVVGFVTVVTVNWIVKKIEPDNSMF